MGARFSKVSCTCTINCHQPGVVHDHRNGVGPCQRCNHLRRLRAGAQSRASAASTSTEYLARPRYCASPTPDPDLARREFPSANCVCCVVILTFKYRHGVNSTKVIPGHAHFPPAPHVPQPGPSQKQNTYLTDNPPQTPSPTAPSAASMHPSGDAPATTAAPSLTPIACPHSSAPPPPAPAQTQAQAQAYARTEA